MLLQEFEVERYGAILKEEGLEEGRQKGLEEGQLAANRATTRRLFQNNMTADFVADITGLPLDEVLDIQKR